MAGQEGCPSSARITGNHTKDWLSDLVFELTTNSGVAWYSVATNRNLPSSIIKLGSFLSALALVARFRRRRIGEVRPRTLLDRHQSFEEVPWEPPRASEASSSSPQQSSHQTFSSAQSASTSPRRSCTARSTDYKFRIRTVVDTSVTTRFKMRTPEMYSSRSHETSPPSCGSTTGGIGVFLPSYALMDSIRDPLLSEIERTAATQGPEGSS